MLRALIRACVHKRLAVIVVTLAVAAYGVSAYLATPIEAYPDVTNYQINVITKAPGLAPEEVEKQITVPLERSLNGTQDVVQMRSESLFGLSLIYLTFDDDADVFKARARVAERVGDADLPDGIHAELGPEDTPLGEIYQYVLVSDRHPLGELRATLEWDVTRELLKVPGVVDNVCFGGFLPELHVE